MQKYPRQRQDKLVFKNLKKGVYLSPRNFLFLVRIVSSVLYPFNVKEHAEVYTLTGRHLYPETYSIYNVRSVKVYKVVHRL